MGVVGQVVKHSIMRTLSVLCVMLVIAGLGWAVYAGIIRPITKPNLSTATSQKADAITNNYINPSTNEIIEVLKKNKESAFEANLFPPKIKIGGLKLSIFDK